MTTLLEKLQKPRLSPALILAGELNKQGFASKPLDNYMVVVKGGVFIYANKKNKKVKVSKHKGGPYVDVKKDELVQAIKELGAVVPSNVVHIGDKS